MNMHEWIWVGNTFAFHDSKFNKLSDEEFLEISYSLHKIVFFR